MSVEIDLPVPYLLMVVAVVVVAFLLFRSRTGIRLMRSRPHSHIEVTVIGDGLNARRIHVGKREFTTTIAKIEYQVKEKDLFQDRGRLRFRDRWRGIRNRYKIVFIQGETDPVRDRPLDEWTAPPEILRIVQRSRSVSEAVRGLFAKAFNPKFLIPLMIGAVVVVVIYFIYTGEITL